jgi:chaperonin cofactor prefoldin
VKKERDSLAQSLEYLSGQPIGGEEHSGRLQALLQDKEDLLLRVRSLDDENMTLVNQLEELQRALATRQTGQGSNTFLNVSLAGE